MRIICLIFVSLLSLRSNAAIVSETFSGRTEASFRTFLTATSDDDESLLDAAMLDSFASALNSSTRSTLDWFWDGSSLSASSFLTADKSQFAGLGGNHVASSLFTFDFTLDSDMQLTLDGSWGFFDRRWRGDLLQVELIGGSGTVFEDSTTSNGGTASDGFGYSGILGPGDYTFTVRAELDEWIFTEDTRLAGWTLNNFELTAVPEPGFSLALLALPVWLCRRRVRFSSRS